MQCKNLAGHSGCRVLLVEDNNSVFVRKIAGSQAYNHRLMLQAEKQGKFPGGDVHVPRIYGMDYTPEGLFYFDMEYIRGITLAEYMKIIQVSGIRSIVTALMNSMQFTALTASAKSQELFTAKICSLADALRVQNFPVVNKALNMLAAHKWDKFPQTSCHGDMTLENIIVKDGRLYLIDFLDSFYDCWIMDAAALLQDVFTMWAYRNVENDINTAIRLMIFLDIMTDIISYTAGATFMNEIYYALLLKLVRIFPYTKDRKTLDFLATKTETVMRLIERHDEDADNPLCRR